MKALELPFPMLGWDQAWAANSQPQGTTPEALNVVPFDAEGRARGGSRSGTRKFVPQQLGGGAPVMQMVMGAIGDASGGVTFFTEPFSYPDGELTGNGGWEAPEQFGAVSFLVSSGRMISPEWDGSLPPDNVAQNVDRSAAWASWPINQDWLLSFETFFGTDGTAGGFISFFFESSVTLQTALAVTVVLTAEHQVRIDLSGSDETGAGFFTNSGNFTFAQGVAHDVQVIHAAAAKRVRVLVDGTERISFDYTAEMPHFDQPDELFVTLTHAGPGTKPEGWSRTDNIILSDGGEPAPQPRRAVFLAAAAGGNIYVGNPAGLTLASGGEDVLDPTRKPSATEAHGKVVFVDGTNTVQLHLDAGEVTALTAADGKGELPAGCRICCLYLGRLVLANQEGFEQNVYLSRSGDIEDWDYSQEDALAAVALNASEAGRIGTPIYALVPFRDDVLLIGGDHSIHALTGDPAAGGRIDEISGAIGIFGPDAWTLDPTGVLWFVGTGGFYRMQPAAGAVPENVSVGRLAGFFAAIDRATTFVEVEWDADHHGCWIFLTPHATGDAIHLWYDARKGGFWPVRFPQNQGPVSALTFDGDDPQDRQVLLGGRDGYVRTLDPAAGDDDGEAIDSHVLLGPVQPAGHFDDAQIIAWDAITADGTDELQAEVQSGSDALAALEADPVALAEWSGGGRQTRLFGRFRSNTFFLRLSCSGRWAVERIAALVVPGGRQR